MEAAASSQEFAQKILFDRVYIAVEVSLHIAFFLNINHRRTLDSGQPERLVYILEFVKIKHLP